MNVARTLAGLGFLDARKTGQTDLGQKFARRGPWITKFTIDGNSYGGWFDAVNDPRVEQFHRAFPAARSVLERGSLEGGHTIAFARTPGVSQVVALEGRAENISRAQFVVELLKLPNVRFEQINLEYRETLASFGIFDAVYCCGLLYHLPRPWELLKQIARTPGNLFLSTHYSAPETAKVVREGYSGSWYTEAGVKDPLSGLSKTSFWPTLPCLSSMLQNNGFAEVGMIQNDEAHQSSSKWTTGYTRRQNKP
ncbi:MAG: class I SAM-dependent methyltransferase [Terriglobales bacterium]